MHLECALKDWVKLYNPVGSLQFVAQGSLLTMNNCFQSVSNFLDHPGEESVNAPQVTTFRDVYVFAFRVGCNYGDSMSLTLFWQLVFGSFFLFFLGWRYFVQPLYLFILALVLYLRYLYQIKQSFGRFVYTKSKSLTWTSNCLVLVVRHCCHTTLNHRPLCLFRSWWTIFCDLLLLFTCCTFYLLFCTFCLLCCFALCLFRVSSSVSVL